MSGLVNDALALLAAVADLELGAEQAEAVALLALVAGQDVEPGQRPGSWRIARKVAVDRVISTVDPQARHTRKTNAQRRDGYKAHVAAEPESGLVTACALTAANLPDGPTGLELLAGEEPGLEVLGDSGYGSRQTRAALRAAGHTQTIKPIRSIARCRAGSPSTTSASTGTLGRSGARRAPWRRSPAPARSALPAGAKACRCGGAAPPPSVAASSACTCTRTSCAPRAGGGDPQLPGKLPALAADGGTVDRLAGRRWLPAGALPRDRAQPGVAVGPDRRGHLRRLLALGLARRDGAWALA